MKLNKIFAMAMLLTFAVSFTSCKNDKKEDKTEMNVEDNAAAKEADAKAAEEAKMEKARKNSIAGLAMESKDLDTLVIALKAANLDKMMMEKGEYTVFAPTNHAFSKVKKKDLNALLNPDNKEMLTKVLQYHVVPGVMTSGAIADSIKANGGKYSVKTSNCEELTFKMDGQQIEINDETNIKAQIVQGNIKASNGIIQKVNKVLMDHK